jgi:hypothetical protein
MASARGLLRDAFAVNPDADRVSLHVAPSDDKQGVHFHLLGQLDLRGI